MDAATIWPKVQAPLERFVLQKTGDADATHDILHNIFLRMQAGLPHLRHRDKLMPWLYRIARNAIIDYQRAEQRLLKIKNRYEPESALAPDLTEEFAACIPQMLEILPEIYREALYLSEIEGLSQKELAERLGLSYPGAKSRVQRGREKLREALEACCHIYTDAYGNIIDYHSR